VSADNRLGSTSILPRPVIRSASSRNSSVASRAAVCGGTSSAPRPDGRSLSAGSAAARSPGRTCRPRGSRTRHPNRAPALARLGDRHYASLDMQAHHPRPGFPGVSPPAPGGALGHEPLTRIQPATSGRRHQLFGRRTALTADSTLRHRPPLRRLLALRPACEHLRQAVPRAARSSPEFRSPPPAAHRSPSRDR
jgi:hypothetical protein